VRRQNAVALDNDRVGVHFPLEGGDDFDRLHTAAKRLCKCAADESLKTAFYVVQ
jgi:hypothetical protein